MSKRNRRKRQHGQPPVPRPELWLGLSAVKLLKDALVFFEHFLAHEHPALPNLPFAREVTAGLRTKLEEMLQREEWEKETPFDYNEIHLLHTSACMYLIELKSSHRQDLIPACITLCEQLLLAVQEVDREVHGQQDRKGG